MRFYVDDININDTLRTLNSFIKKYLVDDLLKALRDFDEGTFLHSLRVGLIMYSLSKYFCLSEILIISGLLHDIGKIGVPKRILTKKSRLTPEEMEELKKHTIFGHRIILKKGLPQIVAEAAKYHHIFQRKSYPLVNPEKVKFRKEVEIVALADKYDSLISNRPYKPSFSHKEAISILKKEFCGDRTLISYLDRLFKG